MLIKIKKKDKIGVINKPLIIFTVAIICILALVIYLYPTEFSKLVDTTNSFFGGTISLYYFIFNFGIFILTFFLAFSKYGNIVLGDKNDKPAYSFWGWGAMMFCSGIGGDIIYYASTDWLFYSRDLYIQSLGNPIDNAIVYSGFCWLQFWIYLVMAIVFGFMFFVRKRSTQKFSESLRPLLKDKVDGPIGNIIDIFSLVILISSVACTQCFTVPIITNILGRFINIGNEKVMIVFLLILICTIYTFSVFKGLAIIEIFSKICVNVFFILIIAILLFGGETRYILDASFKQTGMLLDKLMFLFTNVDPTRKFTFYQNNVAFLIAFWGAWALVVPVFIATISKGMKIKDVILRGYLFATPGCLLGFFIIPNFAVAKQLSGAVNFYEIYDTTGDIFNVVVALFSQLPFKEIILIIVIASIIIFTSTSLDSMSLSCSYFAYKKLPSDNLPTKKMRLFWAIVLVILPIFITFSELDYNIIQLLLITTGYIAIILITIAIIAFFIDVNDYLKEKRPIKK